MMKREKRRNKSGTAIILSALVMVDQRALNPKRKLNKLNLYVLSIGKVHVGMGYQERDVPNHILHHAESS